MTPTAPHWESPSRFSKMTFECFLIFFLLSTCVKTSVHANECSPKLLPKRSPSFKGCSSLFVDGTLTVDLKDFVDMPQCLNENTAIGMKFNQEADDDWDEVQNLGQNTAVVTFRNIETLCQPVNVAIGLNFWNGSKWLLHSEKFEFNPTTCIDENIGNSEIKEIQTKCPNLTLDALISTATTTTTTSTTTISSSTTTTTTTTIATTTTTATTTAVTGTIVVLIICALVIAVLVQRRKLQVLKSEKDAKSKDVEDVDAREELEKGCFGTVCKATLKDSREVE